MSRSSGIKVSNGSSVFAFTSPKKEMSLSIERVFLGRLEMSASSPMKVAGSGLATLSLYRASENWKSSLLKRIYFKI
jgi:hypothetical protein